jgi:hypothetical protein
MREPATGAMFSNGWRCAELATSAVARTKLAQAASGNI